MAQETTRPTTYPDMAYLATGADIATPDTAHAGNKTADPDNIPTSDAVGWSEDEVPPRQWFNWLHRWLAKWVRYLDYRTDTDYTEIINGRNGLASLDARFRADETNISNSQGDISGLQGTVGDLSGTSGNIPVKITTDYLTAEQTGIIYWWKSYQGYVTMLLPRIYGASKTGNHSCEIVPQATYSFSSIFATNYDTVSAVLINDTFTPGMLILPYTSVDLIGLVPFIVDTGKIKGSVTGFDDGVDIGVYRQVITYKAA